MSQTQAFLLRAAHWYDTNPQFMMRLISGILTYVSVYDNERKVSCEAWFKRIGNVSVSPGDYELGIKVCRDIDNMGEYK